MLWKSFSIVTVVLVGLTFLPTKADANDWDEFWARFELDRQRNEAWPQPFLRREQCSVRQPFSAMTARGWQEQNTLSEYHFDPELHVLNQAGLYKVQSILRSSPTAHQSVFVYAGFDPELNQKRMAAVQAQIANWLPEEASPAIVMTTHRPYGFPGTQADAINRRWQESLPTPTLPVTTGGAAGGGGGGGGGGN